MTKSILYPVTYNIAYFFGFAYDNPLKKQYYPLKISYKFQKFSLILFFSFLRISGASAMKNSSCAASSTS